MGYKWYIYNKFCGIHDEVNILHIEPIRNSEENTDNEESSSNGIENDIDKLHYFTTSGDGDNIDTRHDFHDETDAGGLLKWNYIYQ